MAAVTTVANGGVQLVVEEWGSGSPPLMLVHGYTGSRIDWSYVVDDLAQSRRVIAFDHRGHGESTNTGDAASYTFAMLGGDLDAVARQLVGDERYDLVGHSMGGIVAMRYALDHRDALRSLVLMDTGAAPAGKLFGFLGPMVEIGRRDGMRAVADTMADWMVKAGMEPFSERVRGKVASMDVEAFAALGAELGDYASMVDELATLDVPVTILVGENDTGLRASADVMAGVMPGAELVVIAGAGHSPQEDDPAAWVAAVEKHLARAGEVGKNPS